MLTRQPEPDLDKLIYSMGGTAAKDGSRIAGGAGVPGRRRRIQAAVSGGLARSGVRKSRLASADGKIENAAYVVNPSTAPDARLVVDVALKAQVMLAKTSFALIALAAVVLPSARGADPQRVRVTVEREEGSGWKRHESRRRYSRPTSAFVSA